MRTPHGWKREPLHNFAEIRSGLAKNARREGPTVRRPYLRVANVQDGSLNLSDIQEIEVPAGQLARFTLQTGDMLLIEGNGNPANLGRGCLWSGQIRDIVHQNHVFAVRIRLDMNLLPEFLELQIQSNYGRNYFLSCAKGSTGLSSLNSTQLKEFPLLVPPIREQRWLIEVARNWNFALEKTEQLIAAKERAQAAYGSRLFSGKQSSALHWLRADQLFTPVSEKGRGDLEVLSATQDRGIIPRRLLDKKILMESSNTSTFKLVRQDDFVISLRSFQGGLEHSTYEGIVSPAYTVLRPTNKVVSSYFRHYLKSHDFLQRLSVAVIGIRDGKQISFSDFASIKLPVPTKDEQLEYAQLFDALEDEIGMLKKQLDLVRLQKRGLMQKLLTGEWRVPLLEKKVA